MKYGIFGGAFDPPHIQHISMAKAAIKELGLDLLYVVVTYVPPHKSGATASFLDRLNMARLAFKDIEQIVVTDIEASLKDSYSTTVVEALKNTAPDGDWYFIMGGDSVEKLKTWHEPDRLTSLVKFALIRRDGFTTFDDSLNDIKDTIGIDYKILDYIGKECSSSVVQGELELYRHSDRVTPDINAYILEKDLYSRFSDFLSKVKSKVQQKTFEHMSRTALTALAMRSSLKLPFDKVFVAAMLHDIAKGREKAAKEGDILAVKHQFDGAEYAQEEFNIDDKDILDAILTHTTGAANMSDLQKLIFLADMLEPARAFTAVDTLRRAVKDDFYKGFIEAVEYNLEYLKSTNKPIHPLTEQCLEYYKRK